MILRWPRLSGKLTLVVCAPKQQKIYPLVINRYFTQWVRGFRTALIVVATPHDAKSGFHYSEARQSTRLNRSDNCCRTRKLVRFLVTLFDNDVIIVPHIRIDPSEQCSKTTFF